MRWHQRALSAMTVNHNNHNSNSDTSTQPGTQSQNPLLESAEAAMEAYMEDTTTTTTTTQTQTLQTMNNNDDYHDHEHEYNDDADNDMAVEEEDEEGHQQAVDLEDNNDEPGESSSTRTVIRATQPQRISTRASATVADILIDSDMLGDAAAVAAAADSLLLDADIGPDEADEMILAAAAAADGSTSRLVEDVLAVESLAHASASSSFLLDDNNSDEVNGGSDHALPTHDTTQPALSPTNTWRPQTQQSTCEFSHVISNYSKKRESGCKKAEYSPITVDSYGNRWRLIVYVNGNGRASNHHLSLFLQVADSDDLPFGWKKAVSYVLTLEHPSNNVNVDVNVNSNNRTSAANATSTLGYSKRNPDKTFKLCPKAIDWGWSQFITSDRIQQEGYIQNDSLTVRATVTVKSSSVNIDPADTELYLKYAVEEGKADAVKTCLEQRASVNCQFKDDLYTPLHTACSSSSSNGSLEVLNLLLERGADPNACNKWRETPLLIAANNGHRAAVEALLDHGADPSMCSEAGWSALTFAAHKGYDEIVELLLESGAPVNCQVTEDLSTPLHKACAGGKSGHLSAVKQLIDGGADVHALNKWRETPLLTAANHGQAAAVEALLDAGADPCKCTDTGWSPLSIAAYKGHDEVVRLLLEEGAPTEEADPTLSALLQAATKGLPKTVELLLAHGADHTVTTKKGDTALSILVEQNLIDAAVEMVTEYRASVPRCSRDRKKVQRARLLINHRVKQQEKEGKFKGRLVESSDDESDQDVVDGSSIPPLHDENGIEVPAAPSGSKKKKKGKKKKKMTAEEEAKAAEEDLLRSLEEEDAKAQQKQTDANKKAAKKKKKKERDRLQKLKEDKEREEEAARQREEKRKIEHERDRQRQLKREKAMREIAEREEQFARIRKEQEENEKKRRELEKKEREKVERHRKAQDAQLLAAKKEKEKVEREKAAKNKAKKIADQAKVSNVSLKTSSTHIPVVSNSSTGKSRGWETKSGKLSGAPMSAREPIQQDVLPEQPHPFLPDDQMQSVALGVFDFLDEFDSPHTSNKAAQNAQVQQQIVASGWSNKTASPERPAVAGQGKFDCNPEVPAIGIFREQKLAQLLRHCTSSPPLQFIGEENARLIFYRWIIRATHGSAAYLDPMIPSWTDEARLAQFFQRQLIAVTRKTEGFMNMEVLKETGSTLANQCMSAAKEVVHFRSQCNQQIPENWADTTIGLSVSEVNGNGTVLVRIDWSGHPVHITRFTYESLKRRYVGQPLKFFSCVYAMVRRYDTWRALAGDLSIGNRISPSTVMSITRELGVVLDGRSDPTTVFADHRFCGMFEDVDAIFGGFAPFAKEGGGGDVALRNGGSSMTLFPMESTAASLYMKSILDLLESSDTRVPLSFALILPSDCFRDHTSPPSISSLPSLDPRLGDPSTGFLRHIEALGAGNHFYQYGGGDGVSRVSETGSLFLLLQNQSGKLRFSIEEHSLKQIISSMTVNYVRNDILPSSSYQSNESVSGDTPTSAPMPHSVDESTPPLNAVARQTSYGTEASVSSFTQEPSGFAGESRSRRRGRFFELEDNGDEDGLNENDVVSGMFNSLDLFGNANQDVDVEAFSLLGFGHKNDRFAQ